MFPIPTACFSLLIGLAPLSPAAPPPERHENPSHRVAATRVERENVLLIVIDTLRPDHMGCYGYDRQTTPNIDRLAARSLVFDNAYASSSWTRTSVASLLTGLDPYRHGVFSEGGEESILYPSAVSLAEVLRENGYRTAGISGNPHVSRESGFDQGFDSFLSIGKWPQENNTREVAEAALRSLRGLDPAQGNFLYIHFLDPHDPWVSPEDCGSFLAGLSVRQPAVLAGNAYVLSGEFEIEQELSSGRLPRARELSAEELDYLRGLYDCEISLVDREIGRIMKYLEQARWSERTIVILCSDHGEEFGEHGMLRHGYQLFGETVRVPLVLYLPGRDVAGRRSEAVELVDVAPTVLSLVGLSGETEGLDGVVLPGVRTPQAARREAPTAFGVTRFRKRNHAYVVSGTMKLIWDFQAGAGKLYDLGADPREREPREPVESPWGRKLLPRLERWMVEGLAAALPRDATAGEMDEETKQLLRALGYVE